MPTWHQVITNTTPHQLFLVPLLLFSARQAVRPVQLKVTRQNHDTRCVFLFSAQIRIECCSRSSNPKYLSGAELNFLQRKSLLLSNPCLLSRRAGGCKCQGHARKPLPHLGLKLTHVSSRLAIIIKRSATPLVVILVDDSRSGISCWSIWSLLRRRRKSLPYRFDCRPLL